MEDSCNSKNIGIIGYGKMGSEVFHVIFDKKELNNKIVVYCRHNIEENTAKITKELDKGLKRGKYSQEIYDRKKTQFLFTDDLKLFSDCDIVIECAPEDYSVKNNIFKKLDTIVKNNCILATNSSSLDIDQVFMGVSNLERCLGLHFFYPVKLTGFVEINKTDANSEQLLEVVRNLTTSIGKKYVEFSNDYHMYMNQYISVAISTGMIIADKYKLRIDDCKTVYEDIFPMHGLFGMVDSIGIELLRTSSQNFKLERIKNIALKGLVLIEDPSDDFCDMTPLIADCIKRELKAALLEEIKIAMSENDNPKLVYEAAMDAIGIKEGEICVR